MPSESAERCAERLNKWIRSATSPERVASIAKQVGFEIPVLFSRRARKLRIQGEWVIAHSALAILAMNVAFEGSAAQDAIEAFLDAARREVFAPLEREDPTFRGRYEEHIAAYFKTFTGRSLMSTALAFLHYLDLGLVQYVRAGNLDGFDGAREEFVMKAFESALASAVALIKPLAIRDQKPSDEERKTAPADLDVPSRVGFIGMMDIDNFDFLNEKLGRGAGDQVMRAYVQLTASKAGTDTILNEAGFRALLGQVTDSSGDLGYVLCRPYSSGDEFIVFHQSRERLCGLLDAICQEADGLEIPLSDESGRVIGVLHGIPISAGYGLSRGEAWSQVLAKKHDGQRRGMPERVGDGTPGPVPSDGDARDAMQTYLEVLKDEGTSARPLDFVATLQYVEPSENWPPNWPGTPLCGCCAAPFALIARRDGLWMAKGLRDSGPVPICAVCIMHLNELSAEQRGRGQFALSSIYDTLGQQLVQRVGAGDVRKVAVTRILLARARRKREA